MKELYWDIFTEDYPLFIDKYLKLPEFKRIDNIGIFCGCDYVKYAGIKFWYSRLDHCKTVALMTYHFTHNKTMTLAALFHDLGTPCFSHCVDYLLGDPDKQQSSEKDLYEIVNNSDNIKRYLEYDGINIYAFKDIGKFTVVENEKTKLCVDRLDGVLSTCLIWIRTISLEQVREIYNDMDVLMNDQNELEIGFKTKEIAEKFFKCSYDYSIALQKNEDKFAMQFIADILKKSIDDQKLNLQDLYALKETEILKILEQYSSWNTFCNLEKIERSNEKPDGYYVNVSAKRRYTNPLCGNSRITDLSNDCKILLDEYMNFEDSKYAYSKKIKNL